jgi:hypothetical protein
MIFPMLFKSHKWDDLKCPSVLIQICDLWSHFHGLREANPTLPQKSHLAHHGPSSLAITSTGSLKDIGHL